MIGIAFFAFVVRLLIMTHSHGGNDLRIYTYFSRLPLHGLNPFAAPAGGLFPASQSDQAPVEVAVFTGLLGVHDSPTTLRLVFALADVGVLLLIGLRYLRPRSWRLGFVLFYAFNPFVLFAWTVFAEDKTLLFLGIAVWILALERDREWLAWATASALTVFKYLGAFAAPALAWDAFRTRRWRGLAPVAMYLAIFLLSTLPWYPKSLDAFSRRDARLAINPPIHASPTLLLSRIGIYAPWEARVLTAAAIAAVLAFFVARRIDRREVVVWSIFAGYLFLPDDAFNRLLLITLPFMLILGFSTLRWVVIWAVSSIAALAGVVATRGVPHALSAVHGPLGTLFSHEGTVPHVLWMSLLPALILGFYFADRSRTGAREHPTGISQR
ncbi:MAG: hypothetical protein ACXVQR_01025 [Solirubrobacteraceae bacterium]